MITQEEIIIFLIHHQQEFKNGLRATIDYRKSLLKTNGLFKEEIDTQFNRVCRHHIATELGKVFACSPEEVIVLLDGVNLADYLDA
jgi:hypothetical protein